MSNTTDFTILLPKERDTVYATEIDRASAAVFTKMARNWGILPSKDEVGLYYTLEQIAQITVGLETRPYMTDGRKARNLSTVAKLKQHLETRPDLIVLSQKKNLLSRATRIITTNRALDIKTLRLGHKKTYTRSDMEKLLKHLENKTKFEQQKLIHDILVTALKELDRLDRADCPRIVKIPNPS